MNTARRIFHRASGRIGERVLPICEKAQQPGRAGAGALLLAVCAGAGLAQPVFAQTTLHYFGVNAAAGGGNYNNEGATGTDAVAIGKDSTAQGQQSVAIAGGKVLTNTTGLLSNFSFAANGGKAHGYYSFVAAGGSSHEATKPPHTPLPLALPPEPMAPMRLLWA